MIFSHFELLTTLVSKDKGILPVKKEKKMHQNGVICTDINFVFFHRERQRVGEFCLEISAK